MSAREKQNNRRHILKENGLCIHCRQPSNCNATCSKCLEYNKNLKRRLRENLKQEVYRAYGNKCAICGELDPFCLNIDHVDNDGYEKRKNGEDHHSLQLYLKIKKLNYPPNYALLCRHCNWLKHIKHKHYDLYVRTHLNWTTEHYQPFTFI